MKKVLPFFIPPTLLVRQALALGFISRTTGWTISRRWLKDLSLLLKVASGAKKYGCFGYAVHPVFEVTSRCNLRCIHCHARGGEPLYEELDTDEAKHVIESLTSVKEFRTLIFTGGEPLVRNDIFDLTEYARSLGFNIIYATNGTLINKEVAKRMRKSGVLGAAISIDSVDPKRHDYFRGVPGAWKRAIDGIKNVLSEGMYLQVNITISKFNINELEDLILFADKLGAHVILLYTFVSVGRGEVNKWLALSEEEFVKVIEKTADLQGNVKLVIAPVAAPWYYAYLASKFKIPVSFLKRFVTGCITGRGMFYIKPNGDVWPCPFIPITVGNLLKESAYKIWNGELFNKLRDRSNLGEPCRSCPFREVCGGCRARAYIKTGNLFAGDPLCPFKPDKKFKD